MKPMNMSLQFVTVSRVLVLIIIACALVPLASVNAQDVALQSTQEQLVRSNLLAFTKAYTEVGQIHSSYEQRIMQSGDEIKADALQQEANQKMKQAVTDQGLTVEDYNAIFKAIQNDPTLKEEFMTVLYQTR